MHRVETREAALESSGKPGTAPSPAASWLSDAILVLRKLGCVRFLFSAQSSKLRNSLRKGTSISALKWLQKYSGFHGSLKHFMYLFFCSSAIWKAAPPPQPTGHRSLLPEGSLMQRTSRKWLSRSLSGRATGERWRRDGRVVVDSALQLLETRICFLLALD